MLPQNSHSVVLNIICYSSEELPNNPREYVISQVPQSTWLVISSSAERPELLEKARRMNFIKNTFNWGIGFAVSALFLSTLIPKIQYWITKVTTGQNAFPGTADYSYEQKK